MFVSGPVKNRSVVLPGVNLDPTLDEDARAGDVDQLQLGPPREVDARQPGHGVTSLPERHATLVDTLAGQLTAGERVARDGRGAAARFRQDHAGFLRVNLRRLVVREHRGVFDAQLPGAFETVHDLRGDHAAVVLQTKKRRLTAEDRAEEATPAHRLGGRVCQHVERRHGHHLNVGRRDQPLHVREQLPLIGWRQQRRREDQIRGRAGHRRNGFLNRPDNVKVSFDVLTDERGENTLALRVGFDGEDARHCRPFGSWVPLHLPEKRRWLTSAQRQCPDAGCGNRP